MAVALLDTNVLFANASARDEYHERGRDDITEITSGDETSSPESITADFGPR